MTADDNQYQKEREYCALLDSLQELFQEYGDEVTPTRVSERMGQKLHRHISIYVAGCMYTTLGFVANTKPGQARGRYYIVPNPELLAERRAQFCQHNRKESGKD
jgi:hypothetical protein